MSGFKCDLCLEEFPNQFKFFEHLKAHYDVAKPTSLKDSIVQNEGTKPANKVALVPVWSSSLLTNYTVDRKEIDETTLIIAAESLKGSFVSVDNVIEESPEKLLLNSCCPKCNKQFRRGKNFETHLSNCQKKLPQGDEFDDEGKVKLSDVFDILDCNVLVDNPIGIDGEVTDEIIKKINNQVEFFTCGHVCAICEKYFPSRNKHDAHVKKCHPEMNKVKKNRSPGQCRAEILKCADCDRIFNHRNSLVYHMRSHTGERPHQCELCGKSFFATSALKVHKRLHSGEKPYKCDHCGRLFRQWGDLKYHVISIHSDIRQYQCEFCGKDFARKYSLIVHRRIHTGERNYKCEFCGKCFRAASYLQNHRRIHTGEKPHSCSVCAKPFRVRSDMKRHMASHSREQNTGQAIPTTSIQNPPPNITLSSSSQIITIGSQQLSIRDGDTIQVSMLGNQGLAVVPHMSVMPSSENDEVINAEISEDQQLVSIPGVESDQNLTVDTNVLNSIQPTSIQNSVIFHNHEGSVDTVTVQDTNSGTLYVWPVHFMS